MIIEVISDKGERDHNEDFMGYIKTDKYLCAVICDGLGGHQFGELAAKEVVNSIIQDFTNNPTIEVEFIEEYIRHAQSKLKIIQNQSLRHKSMSTTLAMIATNNEDIVVAHVGDSRVYLMNKKKVVYQTKDHSVVGVLLETNQITEEEANHHKDRNRLIRAMGMDWDKDRFTIEKIDIKTNNISHIVLCTDGFWESINMLKMLKFYLKKKSSEIIKKWIKGIIDKNKDSSDNYSVMIIEL